MTKEDDDGVRLARSRARDNNLTNFGSEVFNVTVSAIFWEKILEEQAFIAWPS